MVSNSSESDRIDKQQIILNLIRKLSGLEPLKQLFWSELNYDQINQPLSRQGWSQAAKEALAENPVLFAGSGDFHVIYARLHSPGKLHITDERAVITRLLNEHPYALFVFSDATQVNWHFVNVKLAKPAEDEDNRDTKLRRLFRRISIGPQDRLRTASERIAMLDAAGITPTLFGLSPLDIQKEHDKAFDVEAITETFFKEYTEVFKALQKDLKRQSHDSTWAHDCALQFLNRVMFLYFVQRKRWLGDNPDFLADFWSAYQDSKQPADSFFKNWLSVLFFEAFNNHFSPRQYFSKETNTALQLAPYLNGGLFEGNELDEKYSLEISDKLFRKAFEFFERYNFTISEDSPLDQEVAVDPEMIGKVYESLVNVSEDSEETDEGGQWGIFYTPRTEIELMCRLALVDNLSNHIGAESKPALYEAVFAFEKEERAAADILLAKTDLWPEVDRHLQEITVVDPACGSGSFLVGMLSILSDLRERADNALGRGPRDAQYHYELKKEIIGQSLYGVDVKEWAVRTAELRLWLQLVVDSELDIGIRKLRPLLPNLSFKIRPGDSLIQEVGGIDLSHIHGRAGLPKEVKGKLTSLKAEKLKHYRNERGAWTKEQIDQREQSLFRETLERRLHALTEEAKSLETRIKYPDKQIGLELAGVTGGKPAQIELRAVEWQSRLAEIEPEITELEQALKVISKAGGIPFVWDIAFVEIFESDQKGFDIVVGNPPYVRQEKIAPPALHGQENHASTLEERRAYKAKLMKSIYACYPTFFGYKSTTGNVARKLDAKNDLYVYFYFHGLHLLNPKGSFCFITSNSWLDVGYGKDLQEFLLRHSHVKFVLDNLVKRSFKRADVNTVIVLLAAPVLSAEAAAQAKSRFVMCSVPFEVILSPVAFQEIEDADTRRTFPEFRVHPKKQSDLLEEGLALPEQDDKRAKGGKAMVKVASKYEGNKWGGKYLRAPDIYWRILEKAGDKLVRLGDIAEVRFGIKTGANDFFYVRVLEVKKGIARILCDDGSEHEIEEEFVTDPVFVKTKELVHPVVQPSYVHYRLVRLDHKATRKRYANSYIHWGERQGFSGRPTCATRDRWFELFVPEPAAVIFPIGHKRRPVVGINKFKCQADANFNEIRPHIAKHAYIIAASLYSTFTMLQCELIGRSNFGQGLLKTQTYETTNISVLSPESIDENVIRNLTESIKAMSDRQSLMIYDNVRRPDRIAIDGAFLEAVGFTNPKERIVLVKELHEVSCRMIWNRLAKTDNSREARMTYDDWKATGEPFGEVIDEEE